MDGLGANDLIGKIELYLGKGVTRALLILITMAATVICINQLFTQGLIPLYEFWQAPKQGLLGFLGKAAVTFALGFASALPSGLYMRYRLSLTQKKSAANVQRMIYTSLNLYRTLHEKGMLSDDELAEKRAELLAASANLDDI